MKGLPELMTVEEVADVCRVNIQTVYTWIRTGRLPAFKIGIFRRVRKDYIEKLLLKGHGDLLRSAIS